VSGDATQDTADLNLELLTGRPSGSAVVEDYLHGQGNADAFFRGHFADGQAYQAKAREVDERFDREARRRAADALTVPPGGDEGPLEAFVEEGGYVVTTGQQPALFGGPLYNLYKGLTVAALARSLQEELGVPVLPVFWVGSEDHDWAEANHTALIGMDNELHRAEAAHPDPDRAAALNRLALGEGADQVRDAFLAELPDSDFSASWKELLEASFHPGTTLASGFHALVGEMLGRFGVYLTDAADPVVKGASRPMLLRELDESESLEAVLQETTTRLEEAGYGGQVTLMEGGVNLFLETEAGRERLYRDQGDFRLHTSGDVLSRDALLARLDSDAGALSPNVLLRPVAESAVFPTLAYVAGPGEMAYFAQLGDYFQALGIRMPIVHPRGSATLVESKIRKVLEKFGLEVDDLRRPFHEIAGEIARDEVPAEVQKAMGMLRGSIAQGVAKVESEVKAVDPTLKGPAQSVRSAAFQALDELEKKVTQALKRENEIALAQLEKAQLHLFPDGIPQERVVNPLYYLTRYGGAVLDGLFDSFSAEIRQGPASR